MQVDSPHLMEFDKRRVHLTEEECSKTYRDDNLQGDVERSKLDGEVEHNPCEACNTTSRNQYQG